MSVSAQPSPGKLPYTKPVLRKLKLVGGQVMGIGCKYPEYGLSNEIVAIGGPSLGCGLGAPCYVNDPGTS